MRWFDLRIKENLMHDTASKKSFFAKKKDQIFFLARKKTIIKVMKINKLLAVILIASLALLASCTSGKVLIIPTIINNPFNL